ncbi:flagellar hook-basal body complex protein FliE [Spongiibacter taiwanensis]|uniref:flagellar hook-basal body complex protein FliE n=1 Tax=Spongiibacter taiwanensis TaxID=1748242 RepID=UPI002036156C|nr:flagellar hook-basal body complex protein FliE [Spongiibacter taiwanensis]USA43798.1 flagellar hook-basal body complex protein FliE [Spongiibacter taiwanensis]
MSDSLSVNQLLSQIRTIRQQTAMPAQNPMAQNTGELDRVNPNPGELRTGSVGGPQQTGFSQLLTQSIDAVNEMQSKSGALSAAFSSGDKNVSLTEVMVASQKADVSFKALVEVRNKFVDAYQEVMRMSI